MDKESLGEDSIFYREELVCEASLFKHCLYNQAHRHMEDIISVQKLNGRAKDKYLQVSSSGIATHFLWYQWCLPE